jgi:outer membrane immunogenic protein
MKTLFGAGVLSALLISGAAMAADMPVKAVYKAPPVEYFSWTGCFIGGNAGGLWARKEWASRDQFFAGAAPIPVGTSYGTHDLNSWVGGVQAGCDYQFGGGFVIGIQGDYDWSNANGSSNNLLSVTSGDRSRIRSLASVTGRIGYAFDRALLYVRGGGAWERDNYEFYTLTTGTFFANASETRGGWVVGAGLEYAFTNMFSGFVEYDYYDFGTRTNNFVLVNGGVGPSTDIRERKSVIRLGLNLRFGGGPVVARY